MLLANFKLTELVKATAQPKDTLVTSSLWVHCSFCKAILEVKKFLQEAAQIKVCDSSWSFSKCILLFWTPESPVPSSSIISERKHSSPADSSNTWQLTPKQSSWTDGTQGKRKNLFFVYFVVNYSTKSEFSPVCARGCVIIEGFQGCMETP